MSKHDIRSLERSDYISLSTRKRSGDYVDTPVWFAPLDDSYYIFSAGDAGKVKRLRNFSESRIASCTVSGKLTGEWMKTSAEVLDDPADQAKALQALHIKYGWKMRMTDFFSSMSGKMKRRAYIRVDLVDQG